MAGDKEGPGLGHLEYFNQVMGWGEFLGEKSG